MALSHCISGLDAAFLASSISKGKGVEPAQCQGWCLRALNLSIPFRMSSCHQPRCSIHPLTVASFREHDLVSSIVDIERQRRGACAMSRLVSQGPQSLHPISDLVLPPPCSRLDIFASRFAGNLVCLADPRPRALGVPAPRWLSLSSMFRGSVDAGRDDLVCLSGDSFCRLNPLDRQCLPLRFPD